MGTIQNGTRKRISRSERTAIENWLNFWLEYAAQSNEIESEISAQFILPPKIHIGENVFELISFINPHAQIRFNRCRQLFPGHLSIGLPEKSFFNPDDSPNLYWFPTGVPAGRSLCISSSRLGQKLDQYDQWFDALRTLATRIDSDSEFLITADNTTTDRYLRRVGELFRISVVDLHHMPDRPTKKWMHECLCQSSQLAEHPPQNSTCYFQILSQNDSPSSAKQPASSIDATLIAIAAEVHLLSVRNGGNIHTSVKRRLQQCPATTTKLLVKSRTKKRENEDLISDGAIAWWLYPDPDEPTSNSQQHQWHANVPRLTLAEFPADRFLLHWTRRRIGPWPDQTETQFLDDLIFQTERRQHHETAVLSRILATHRILASSELTRDSQPVVSFSNRPLTEIENRKIFRQHLGRWDFLPFGIAIIRQVLEKLGAKPVIYGNEATWESLAPSEQPFFQTATSANGKIDWTTEKEWRLAGDLDLNQLDIGSVVVFAENETAAQTLAPLSRWPIIALNS